MLPYSIATAEEKQL